MKTRKEFPKQIHVSWFEIWVMDTMNNLESMIWNDCFMARELEKLVKDEVEKNKLERMVKVGLWCIQDDPSERPSMKKVILMLEHTIPSFSSNFLYCYRHWFLPEYFLILIVIGHSRFANTQICKELLALRAVVGSLFIRY